MLKYLQKICGVEKKVLQDECCNRRISSEQEIIEYKKGGWVNRSELYDRIVEKELFIPLLQGILATFVKPNTIALDIGCGTGRGAFLLAEMGCEVLASDIDQGMLDFIEKNKEERNISTILADSEKGIPTDILFDIVTSFDCIVHYPNWVVHLEKMAKLCKEGGFICYNFRSSDNHRKISEDLLEASHFLFNNEYLASTTRLELDKVCEKLGLEIITLYPAFFFLHNALYYNYLTYEEMSIFITLFRKMLQNPDFLHVMLQFEKEVVQKQNIETSSTIFVVLRKK